MRTVYLDFTSSRATFPIFNWLIQLVEQVPYSHVRISFRSGWFDHTVIEASGTSVKLIGVLGNKNYPVKLRHRYQVELTDDQYKHMISLLRYAGAKYGLKQAIGIGIQRLFRLRLNPFKDADRSFICSELVGYFLFRVMGLQIPDDECPDLESIGPKGIKQWIDTRPDLFKKVKI